MCRVTHQHICYALTIDRACGKVYEYSGKLKENCGDARSGFCAAFLLFAFSCVSIIILHKTAMSYIYSFMLVPILLQYLDTA